MHSKKILGLLALAFTVSFGGSFSQAAVGKVYSQVKPKNQLSANSDAKNRNRLAKPNRNVNQALLQEQMAFYADPNVNTSQAARSERAAATCPYKSGGTTFERVNTNSGTASPKIRVADSAQGRDA